MGGMLSESLIFPTALLYVPRGFPGGESGGRPDGAVVARIQLCCHDVVGRHRGRSGKQDYGFASLAKSVRNKVTRRMLVR
ncbi:hypothetical protein D3C71_1241500 [compost metagenome]